MVYLGVPVGLFLVYMGYARSLPPRLVQKIESGASRLTILALVIFGIGILEPARDLLWSNPGRFLLYLVIVTCLGAGMAYLTAIVMYRQGITDALTASIVSGFRNVGLGILAPARDLLWGNPGQFILYLVIVTSLGAGMAYLTAIVMYRYGMSDALTASIVSGFRNVGLGFALLPSASLETTAAYVGISQIPIFLAPLVLNYLVRGSHQAEPALQPAE